MTAFRRRLRFWVAAWLVFQVASLSALVPRDCCAAHLPATDDTEQSCHENAAAAYCPMRAADGTPCPMHRGRHSHSDAKRGSGDQCSLRGTCDGPMAALAALLSNHGVLTDSFVISPDLHVSCISAGTREHLISSLASPDPPPPRA